MKQIVRQNFFVIDRENAKEAVSHLYGYAIEGTDVYTALAPPPPDWRPGEYSGGAWVYVERTSDAVTISQDLNGCQGLYLFRDGDYFALSNSFMLLAEHLRKGGYPMTLNRDCALFMFGSLYSSRSAAETMVQEIEMLPRKRRVVISLGTGELTVVKTGTREQYIPLDTVEGLAALDEWAAKWAAALRALKERTDCININLSGGFDSRTVFTLVLLSGIDLGEVNVQTYNKDVHTWSEDYEIAKEIAARYGFRLNGREFQNKKRPLPLAEFLEMEFYVRATFHNQLVQYTEYNIDPVYAFGGTGGEPLRDYWPVSPEIFISCMAANTVNMNAGMDVAKALERVMWRGVRLVETEREAPLVKLSPIYRETENRHHFGKGMVMDYLRNHIQMAPLMDPMLNRLKLDTLPDRNLLYALIFSRYNSELMELRFEGGRSIHPDTVRYARMMNERYPFPRAEEFRKLPRARKRGHHDSVKSEGEKRDVTIAESREADEYLLSAYRSPACRALFTKYFPAELYDFAEEYAKDTKFFPLAEVYVTVAVTKVLMEIEASHINATGSAKDAIDLMTRGFGSELPDGTDGVREAVRRLIPFIGKRRLLYVGDEVKIKRVMEQLSVPAEDTAVIRREGNTLSFGEAINAMGTGTLSVFLTDFYEPVKNWLTQKGLAEGEDFMDGRGLLR